MSDGTKIEWTDATWNPVTGCTKVSPGCDHCYAETFAERWRGTPGHHFEHGFDVTLRPERLEQPSRWTRPRRIFVNSMSDLFHDSVPDGFIARVWDVRERTEAASILSPGPWTATVSGNPPVPWVTSRNGLVIAPGYKTDLDYIASMHPLVGLALADFLDAADRHAELPAWVESAALKIARTILGTADA